jgi:type I restriction enzyme, R subunit
MTSKNYPISPAKIGDRDGFRLPEDFSHDHPHLVTAEGYIEMVDSRGAIDVLRNGFKCYGKTFQLAYFQPNTGMNPDTLALYAQNRLTLTRQVKIKTGRIPDLILSINGLPFATIELKNPMTGQTYHHAIHQYQHDRDPKDPLFAFKERCLVHFAVDTEEVWMTTKLAGESTFFLPFNRGNGYGAGNPVGENSDYRTSYLRKHPTTRHRH